MDEHAAALDPGLVGVDNGKGEQILDLVTGPGQVQPGVVEGVVGQGVAPVAGAIHRQGAVNALQGDGLAGVPIDEDGLAVAEVQRARGVQAEIDPQVRQGAGRGQQGELRAGAIRQVGLVHRPLRTAQGKRVVRRFVRGLGRSGWPRRREGWTLRFGLQLDYLLADQAAGRREEVPGDAHRFRPGIRGDGHLVRLEDDDLPAAAPRPSGHAGTGRRRRQVGGRVGVAVLQGRLNLVDLGNGISRAVRPGPGVDVFVDEYVGHPAQVELAAAREGDRHHAVRPGDDSLAGMDRAVGGEHPFEAGRGHCLDGAVDDEHFADGLGSCCHVRTLRPGRAGQKWWYRFAPTLEQKKMTDYCTKVLLSRFFPDVLWKQRKPIGCPCRAGKMARQDGPAAVPQRTKELLAGNIIR